MTKSQFVCDKMVSVCGSFLQGYTETTYDKLASVFGEPTTLRGDKTTVEWAIQFHDGTIASVYDWKRSETPMGLYSWHIGGKSKRAVDLVNLVLRDK